jgi:hypothetical protein
LFAQIINLFSLAIETFEALAYGEVIEFFLQIVKTLLDFLELRCENSRLLGGQLLKRNTA